MWCCDEGCMWGEDEPVNYITCRKIRCCTDHFHCHFRSGSPGAGACSTRPNDWVLAEAARKGQHSDRKSSVEVTDLPRTVLIGECLYLDRVRLHTWAHITKTLCTDVHLGATLIRRWTASLFSILHLTSKRLLPCQNSTKGPAQQRSAIIGGSNGPAIIRRSFRPAIVGRSDGFATNGFYWSTPVS